MCGSLGLRGLQRVELVSLGYWIAAKGNENQYFGTFRKCIPLSHAQVNQPTSLILVRRMLLCSTDDPFVFGKQGAYSLLSRRCFDVL